MLIGGPSSGASLEERATRFQDPLERLLYLRVESQLSSLTPREISLLAESSQERFFAEGRPLMEQGSPAPAVHFLVAGRVAFKRDGQTFLRIAAPGVVGVNAVMSRDPQGVEVVAEEDALTLAVRSDIMLDLVEDNFGVARGMLGGLSGALLDCQRELESRGLLERSEPVEVAYPEDELDLVQRLSLVRRGPYAEVNLQPLAELIAHAEEVRFEPGAALWEVGEAADFGVHVVYGALDCQEPDGGRQFVMGPGSVVGVLEAHSRRPRSYRAVAQTRVVAIRTPLEAFIDVLEDHPELGMGLIQFLGAALMRLQIQLAAAE